MLEDKFGRRFQYLRLSVTDVCNFRCSYCLPDGYQCDSDRDFLSQAEIKTIAAAFAGLGTRKIRLTGGEPSLRKDLPEIIGLCANTPGIEQVALTTNGFKLPQMIGTWVEAGLNAINVSIDSLDPRHFSMITGHDKLNTILAGVDKALSAGIRVKINSVMLRPYSGTMLDQALAWLRHTPVSLRLIELMQTGDNQTFFKHNHVSGLPVKERLLEQGWIPVIRETTAGPAQEFAHPDFAGRIGLIMPYSNGFCDSCNRLRVSATGNLHLCLFAEKGLPLREYLQEADVGVLQTQLKALIGHKEASHWLDKGFTGATTHLAMLGG
ncbi:GTP 3',8-cyclase MoaA [Aliiglaciecola sp. CAU 1673]|uniref:GTP 3',8-cyclase MoaA n=1 Tax=Aliiglaciecola sp. CAU 1673 TaxID=3032595 RepID=UPI0023DCC6A8|nr:GTP 3',8-cyclase MoaA [Aliiglaciecola sp. CAU 1673]MDF2177021.1 GTP 3',8-cyclase MoaA [Aliiglaciecola sp. CAU 1673]